MQPAMDATPADLPVAQADPSALSNENSPEQAVTVVRDYYAAINARDYPRAYQLWANAGAASRQSLQQFATGFAATTAVSVNIGSPGMEDAGAGQRYIRIPVDLHATQADGSVQHFNGDYVLHRTVVDGATAGQHDWRIQSADLRLVQP